MPFQAHPADHRFYGTMSVVAAAVIIAGFASVYAPKVMTGTPPVLPAGFGLAALIVSPVVAQLSATGVRLALAAWLVR